MGDGYTEIFFLDEATALAAGHRPCFECRRADARAFAAAWPGAARRPPARRPWTGPARRAPGPPEPVAFGDLPAGAIFAADGGFHLRAEAGALAWSFAGYDARAAPSPRTRPSPRSRRASVRAVLAAGYRAAAPPERAEPSGERAVGRRIPAAGEAVAVRIDAVAVALRPAAGQERPLRRVARRGTGRSCRAPATRAPTERS